MYTGYELLWLFLANVTFVPGTVITIPSEVLK